MVTDKETGRWSPCCRYFQQPHIFPSTSSMTAMTSWTARTQHAADLRRLHSPEPVDQTKLNDARRVRVPRSIGRLHRWSLIPTIEFEKFHAIPQTNYHNDTYVQPLKALQPANEQIQPCISHLARRKRSQLSLPTQQGRRLGLRSSFLML